jgi:hypothetical protein
VSNGFEYNGGKGSSYDETTYMIIELYQMPEKSYQK